MAWSGVLGAEAVLAIAQAWSGVLDAEAVLAIAQALSGVLDVLGAEREALWVEVARMVMVGVAERAFLPLPSTDLL